MRDKDAGFTCHCPNLLAQNAQHWLKKRVFFIIIIFMYRKINSVRLAQFGGQFFGLCLFQLGDASH